MSLPHTVVVLHAHPDDEAIFTGLTIRRLSDSGVRVVLVMATDGEAGVHHVPLSRGESLRARRLVELERSCEFLGVTKLEIMGYGDSGAHGGPYKAGTLGATPEIEIARRVAKIAHQEGASSIVHYDSRGIYGHIDHVQVHRAGAMAARSLGLTGYQATVDGATLFTGPHHVLHRAASNPVDVGVSASDISITVVASHPELLAKMAAMATYASQVTAAELNPACFAGAYSREWLVRDGEPGELDAVLTTSILSTAD